MNLSIFQRAARQFKEAAPDSPQTHILGLMFLPTRLAWPAYLVFTNGPLEMLSIPPELRNSSQKRKVKFELMGVEERGSRRMYRDRRGRQKLLGSAHVDLMPTSSDTTAAIWNQASRSPEHDGDRFCRGRRASRLMSACHLTHSCWTPFPGKISESQITFPAKLKRALARGNCALAASIIAIVAESVHDCDAHATLRRPRNLEFMR
jgi:hypothetical protein